VGLEWVGLGLPLIIALRVGRPVDPGHRFVVACLPKDQGESWRCSDMSNGYTNALRVSPEGRRRERSKLLFPSPVTLVGRRSPVWSISLPQLPPFILDFLRAPISVQDAAHPRQLTDLPPGRGALGLALTLCMHVFWHVSLPTACAL